MAKMLSLNLVLCLYSGPTSAQDLFLSGLPDASTSPALITDDVAGHFEMNAATRTQAEALMTSFSRLLNEPTEDETHSTREDSLDRYWLDPGFADAKCLDGSPYAYYFRPAPAGSAHAKDWVIFLQGGGVCVSFIDCTRRGSTSLGSSSSWNSTLAASSVVSNDATLNPFWDFNHVLLPYCTGDAHTGMEKRRNAYFLFFAGALNLEASFTQLKRERGLGDAERMIFSGASAGGIGVHNNADWAQAMLPSVKVVALPFAAMFFPEKVELELTLVLRELHILAPEIDINRLAAKVVTSLWSSRLPAPCAAGVAAEEAFRCWDASFNYNFIQVPTLYIQNMFDQYQLDYLLLCPQCGSRDKRMVARFGRRMRETLGVPPLHSTRRHSVWLQACYDHVKHLCFKAQVQVQNWTLHDFAANWFFNDRDAVLVDACASDSSSVQCNPQCSAVPCWGW